MVVGLWVGVVVVGVVGSAVVEVTGLVVVFGPVVVGVVSVDLVVVIVVGLVPGVPGLVSTQDPSIQTPPGQSASLQQSSVQGLSLVQFTLLGQSHTGPRGNWYLQSKLSLLFGPQNSHSPHSNRQGPEGPHSQNLLQSYSWTW